MEFHLQAKGLNIWRVTSEGMKNKSQQKKQFDAIAKCVILSSFKDNMFNHVFACENAKDLWKATVLQKTILAMTQLFLGADPHLTRCYK